MKWLGVFFVLILAGCSGCGAESCSPSNRANPSYHSVPVASDRNDLELLSGMAIGSGLMGGWGSHHKVHAQPLIVHQEKTEKEKKETQKVRRQPRLRQKSRSYRSRRSSRSSFRSRRR